MKIFSKRHDSFETTLNNENHTSVIEKLCIILLALAPLLQHYDSVFQDAGTIALVIVLCYYGFRLLKLDSWRYSPLLPLILFSVYEIINHGIGVMEIAREGVLIVYYIVIACCLINTKFFIKIITFIAICATALVVIQYICYYVFDFHLQVVPSSWLSNKAEQWVLLVKTGRISAVGGIMSLYRPSAFFLEPSHMTIFCFPIIIIKLLDPELKIKNILIAAFISGGVILTTSGMGIMLICGIWFIFIIYCLMGKGTLKERVKRLFSKRSLACYLIMIGIIVLAYFKVSLFQASVDRIFFSAIEGGNSAIGGRMNTGIKSIGSMNGLEYLLGKSDWGKVHEWNMTGFFYVLYTQGIIGLILSYAFYVYSIFKTKRPYYWIAIIIIGLSFVTIHTHAAFYMLYYVLILHSGLDKEKHTKAIPNPIYKCACRLKKIIYNKKR